MYRRDNTITAEQQAYLRSREHNIVTPEQLGCQGSLEYRAERAAREKTMNFNLKQTVLAKVADLTRALTPHQRSKAAEGLPDSCPEAIRNLIIVRRCGVEFESRPARKRLSRAAVDQQFASTAAAIIAKVDQEQEQDRRNRRRNLLFAI